MKNSKLDLKEKKLVESLNNLKGGEIDEEFKKINPNLDIIERDLGIIGNDIRFKILKFLYNSNGKINFNQISEKLGIDRSKLAYHLPILRESNLIINESSIEQRAGKKFSFYSISPKGKKYFNVFYKMSV